MRRGAHHRQRGSAAAFIASHRKVHRISVQDTCLLVLPCLGAPSKPWAPYVALRSVTDVLPLLASTLTLDLRHSIPPLYCNQSLPLRRSSASYPGFSRSSSTRVEEPATEGVREAVDGAMEEYVCDWSDRRALRTSSSHYAESSPVRMIFHTQTTRLEGLPHLGLKRLQLEAARLRDYIGKLWDRRGQRNRRTLRTPLVVLNNGSLFQIFYLSPPHMWPPLILDLSLAPSHSSELLLLISLERSFTGFVKMNGVYCRSSELLIATSSCGSKIKET
ncbi:hypothetical protein B0H13DRAFT_2300958 [Mycena leptocephala]|nr:hypothetical protein B0H13DRAFT_2300958 [Mycena leptocephala]